MKRARELILPAYLLAAILLGGSSQSIWGVAALQFTAVLILAWAALQPRAEPGRTERTLLLLCILLVFLFLLQLIPMPPALWTRLPGRQMIAEGYRMLGRPLPFLPVSVSPYDTLATFGTLLPPLAVIAAVVRLRAYNERYCAAAILLGTAAAILLGFIQITAGGGFDTHWYLYRETNPGSAVGFFANRNHMGTLLLVAIPFAGSLFFAPADTRSTDAAALRIFGVAVMVVILLGLAMNGSLAAVLLAAPVIAASASRLPALGRARAVLASAAGLALIAATIFLAASPVQPKVTAKETASIEGRQEIWTLTRSAISSTFPVGTGMGTFANVYAAREPLGAVKAAYVNHAHNDYLELVLEGGAVAALLAAAFLLWWMREAYRVFSSGPRNGFGSAAAIASGAVLAHSLVDYPLRTSAIAALFAFSIALMAAGPGKPRPAL